MKNNRGNTKFLFLLFYILPVIDMINGIMIRKFNISGIGSFFHLLLLILLVTVTYLKPKIVFTKYDKCTFFLLVVFIISTLFNSIFINTYHSISLARVGKILNTAITISCLVCLQKQNQISHDDLNKLLKYMCVLISFASLFANVTGLGNVTYESAKLGMTGFFTGSNEPIAIYIMLNVFLVYTFSKNNRFSYLLPFIANEINLIYAQSKSAYMSAALFAIVMILLLLKMLFRNGKLNKKMALFVIPGFIVFVLVSKKIISSTISGFILRQTFIKDAYSGTSFLNYIFSGRIGRIEKLIFPIFNNNLFISIFQFLFGQGLNFDYYEIIEIDILDAFLYGGLFASVILILFMFFVLKDIWKTTKSKLAIFLVLIIYFFSFTAGHIWTGGISGTYFSLFCTFLMFENKKCSSNLKLEE